MAASKDFDGVPCCVCGVASMNEANKSDLICEGPGCLLSVQSDGECEYATDTRILCRLCAVKDGRWKKRKTTVEADPTFVCPRCGGGHRPCQPAMQESPPRATTPPPPPRPAPAPAAPLAPPQPHPPPLPPAAPPLPQPSPKPQQPQRPAGPATLVQLAAAGNKVDLAERLQSPQHTRFLSAALTAALGLPDSGGGGAALTSGRAECARLLAVKVLHVLDTAAVLENSNHMDQVNKVLAAKKKRAEAEAAEAKAEAVRAKAEAVRAKAEAARAEAEVVRARAAAAAATSAAASSEARVQAALVDKRAAEAAVAQLRAALEQEQAKHKAGQKDAGLIHRMVAAAKHMGTEECKSAKVRLLKFVHPDKNARSMNTEMVKELNALCDYIVKELA